MWRYQNHRRRQLTLTNNSQCWGVICSSRSTGRSHFLTEPHDFEALGQPPPLVRIPEIGRRVGSPVARGEKMANLPPLHEQAPSLLSSLSLGTVGPLPLCGRYLQARLCFFPCQAK